jgi:hypothetical protein
MQIGDVIHLDGLRAEYSLSAVTAFLLVRCPTEIMWFSVSRRIMSTLPGATRVATHRESTDTA